jgi:capsular polysaccharide biosynthesis protein
VRWLVSFGFLRNSLRSKFPLRENGVIALGSLEGTGNHWIVNNAVLDTISGYVFDSSGRFIAESSSWDARHALRRMPAKPVFPRKVKTKSELIFLGTEAYYHWLIEELPAFLRALKAYPSASVGIRNSSPKYVVDVLTILGITPRVLPLYSRVTNLALSKKSHALEPSQVDLNLLSEFQNKANVPNGNFDKIYVSRLDSGRFPENELEIQDVFRSFGFKIVELAGTSIAEQIALFSNADFVAGTHGAGLANLVWINNENCSVIEIAKSNQPDCFERIAEIKGLNYFRLDSKSEEHWIVDIDELRNILK